ncbi:DUF6122 family protein [Salegentibacter chungangensis]|uniref:DUF6122 family protein n=1 Tax=Salegentibacter chungangensis TaxID=1335724 RepID=A0ABW3NQI4_9FLAO
MLQTFTHYFLHFIAIGLIAWLYDPKNWRRNWFILLGTMLVDLDHIFANPIFDPNRCGIGFHPLHSELAIGVYFFGILLIRHKIIRLISIGLLFHMVTDLTDCLWMFSKCEECYYASELSKYGEFLFRK